MPLQTCRVQLSCADKSRQVRQSKVDREIISCPALLRCGRGLPVKAGREEFLRRENPKCVRKQFGISSAVVELIRPILGSNAGRLYAGQHLLYFPLPFPLFLLPSLPRMASSDKYTDSSIYSGSTPDIISLNSLYSITSLC